MKLNGVWMKWGGGGSCAFESVSRQTKIWAHSCHVWGWGKLYHQTCFSITRFLHPHKYFWSTTANQRVLARLGKLRWKCCQLTASLAATVEGRLLRLGRLIIRSSIFYKVPMIYLYCVSSISRYCGASCCLSFLTFQFYRVSRRGCSAAFVIACFTAGPCWSITWQTDLFESSNVLHGHVRPLYHNKLLIVLKCHAQAC